MTHVSSDGLIPPAIPVGPATVARIQVTVAPIHSALTSLALLSLADGLPGLNRWVVETAAALTPALQLTNRLVFLGLPDALGPEALPPDVLAGAHLFESFPDYLHALATCDPTALRDRALERFLARFHFRAASAQGAFSSEPTTMPDADRLLGDLDAYLTCARLAGTPAIESAGGPADWPGTDDRAINTEAHVLLRDPVALRRTLVDHLTALWDTFLAAEWRRVQPKLDWQAEMFTRALTGDESPADAFRLLTGRALPPAVRVALASARVVTLVPTWHLGRQVIVSAPEPSANAGNAPRSTGIARVYFSEPPNYDVAVMRAAPVGAAELRARLAALADETRLRILALCANRDELTAQEIITAIDLSQSNVSRQLKQLVEAGYLYERRGTGANKTYRLSAFYFDRVAGAVELLALPPAPAASAAPDERTAVSAALRRFLDSAGRVTTWPPAKQRDKLLILEYLAGRFDEGRAYAEREVNDVLGRWSVAGDTAALRRALYEFRFMNRARDGSRYWLSGPLEGDDSQGGGE